ncbi:MAG: hypothetical protein ACPGSM_01995 [Thiolinea sp.]
MRMEQVESSLGWNRIAYHQFQALLRKGGTTNFVARPAFLFIWFLCVYVFMIHMGTQWLWIPAFFNLYFALALYRRFRLITDTATSQVSSGAQGYVELEGTAWLPDGEYSRGLSHLPVTVWLPGYIEDQPFYLVDEAGRCLLYPDEAEIVTQPADNHLYWLHAIYPGQTLHVLGDMRTYAGDNINYGHSHRVAEILTQWKSRPHNLLNEFDHNDNGRLDPDEWEEVVGAAHQMAREDQIEQRDHPGTHIIDRSEGGRLFMITNIPPEQLAMRYRWASWLHTGSWLGLLVFFQFS